MSFRIEDKYLINQIDYIKVKKLLQKNNFKETYEKRLITSLYFDNKFLSMFHDSEEGVVPRKKIRFRYYNNDKSKIFFEFKINSVEGKFKRSEKISLKDFNNFCIKGKHDPSYGVCLPKLYVNYLREYFATKDLRITIDKEINFKSHRGVLKVKENFYILEIKTLNFLKNIEFLEGFPKTKIRYSKYSEGIKKIFISDQNNRIFN